MWVSIQYQPALARSFLVPLGHAIFYCGPFDETTEIWKVELGKRF